MTPVLSADGITACFGRGEPVVRNASFELGAGQISVLLGANGAGKTTLMRAISGLMSYTGSVRMHGISIDHLKPAKRAANGLAHVPQGRGVLAELTVSQNLQLGAYRRSDDAVREDVERYYDLFPQLADRRELRAGMLSGGEQQMLAICRCLMSRPEVLILDEPSLGLAPVAIERVFEFLKRVNEETGLSIFLVEQNANIALQIASYSYLLETGHVVAEGPAQEMLDDSRLRTAYLGY